MWQLKYDLRMPCPDRDRDHLVSLQLAGCECCRTSPFARESCPSSVLTALDTYPSLTRLGIERTSSKNFYTKFFYFPKRLLQLFRTIFLLQDDRHPYLHTNAGQMIQKKPMIAIFYYLRASRSQLHRKQHLQHQCILPLSV